MQTAEEFLTDKYKAIYYRRPEGFTSKVPEHAYLRLYVSGRIDGKEQNYPEMMIEFAKLHVEAALKNAYDCGRFKGWTNSNDENVHKELFVKNIMSRNPIK